MRLPPQMIWCHRRHIISRRKLNVLMQRQVFGYLFYTKISTFLLPLCTFLLPFCMKRPMMNEISHDLRSIKCCSVSTYWKKIITFCCFHMFEFHVFIGHEWYIFIVKTLFVTIECSCSIIYTKWKHWNIHQTYASLYQTSDEKMKHISIESAQHFEMQWWCTARVHPLISSEGIANTRQNTQSTSYWQSLNVRWILYLHSTHPFPSVGVACTSVHRPPSREAEWLLGQCQITGYVIQSGTVITRPNITWYCTHHCNDWGRV